MTSDCSIINQGYAIANNKGEWLTQDLTWTLHYDERGVWHELVDAELAMARRLKRDGETT